MNIDEGLYSDMLKTSPQHIRYLNQVEIEKYGIIPKDPFIEEAESLNKAKHLGISRIELASREAIEFKLCGPWPDFNKKDEFLNRMACRDRVIKTGRQ